MFKELFKLEDSLAKRLDVLQESLFCGASFVGMSFRFNQLLGDFKDTIGTPLDTEEQYILMNKCIEEVDRLHKQNHPNSKVLITADSTKFVEKIDKVLDYVVIIPGKSVHMDQMKMKQKKHILKFSLICLCFLGLLKYIYYVQVRCIVEHLENMLR